MAQRILHFRLADVIPKVQQALTELHNFLYTSYKGIYCSLCDAENHSMFDIEKKEITLSENFCREIVSHSLHALLYFQVHFKKIVELVATFLSSCDSKGEFDPQQSVPASVLVEIKEEEKQTLSDCRSFRNDPGWLKYCGKICEQFQLTNFSEFFQPDVKKYYKATLFIEEVLTKFKPGDQDVSADGPPDGTENAQPKEEESKKEETPKQEETPEEKESDEKEEKDGKEGKEGTEKSTERSLRRRRMSLYTRYLKEEETDKKEEETGTDKSDSDQAEGESEEDDDEEKEETIIDLEKKYEKMEILQKSMNATVQMDKATLLYAHPGIDLYKIGKGSKITEENYKLVKALGLISDEKPKAAAPVITSEFVGILRNTSLLFFVAIFGFKTI